MRVLGNTALALIVGISVFAPVPPAHAQSPAAAPPAGDATNSWDLTDLYPSEQAWEQSYTRTQAATDKLASYQGSLGKSAAAMLTALDAISAVNREATRLAVYAGLKSDEDVRIGANLGRKQRAQALFTRLAEKTAWVAPEILKLGAGRVRAFATGSKPLKQRFGFFLDNTLRAAPHTLGLEAEKLLASAGDLLAQPDILHSQLANGELPVPTILLADGSNVRLVQSAYQKYRQSANRADRKRVFDAFWGAWKQLEGTSGAMLTTQVMGDHFRAQARKFDSALRSAQFPDNMPDTVYRTLVAETNAALPTLHRYLRLRKQLLGITDDLQYYDSYPSLFHLEHEPHFSVPDSERITLEALQPLGEDYLGLLRKGFAARWMNVYPHDGKANGAYMNGSAYDVHPYLLLNDNGDYDSLSTLAHEWGHAVHTLLSNRAQPFETAGYSTFIAEAASIGNEMLLNDYMVEHAASRDEKLYYLGEGVESIRTTFFRQTMFAEFELAIHEELEQGRSLSGERISELYCGLLKRYYGDAEGVMKIDPAYCLEWAMVPHFYYNFYVYQYATSMAGAAFFTDAVLREGAPARQRFLTLLSAGASDYPYDLYRRAGVDMATPGPYRALVARMNHLLDEIEALEAQH
jgi:oligoendopeptidase F